MSKVEIVKEAFQHSLSQIRIAMPQNLRITKIQESDSVKRMILELLEQLPTDLKDYICSSLAHCKVCGYHGPIPVIQRAQQLCQCGSELNVIIQPLLYIVHYASACSLPVKDLAAVVTLDHSNGLHAVLVNQVLQHYIMCSPGEDKVFVKYEYIDAYFRSQLDSPFYPKLGKIVIAVYANNSSNRRISFYQTSAYNPGTANEQTAASAVKIKVAAQEAYNVLDGYQAQRVDNIVSDVITTSKSGHFDSYGIGMYYKLRDRKDHIKGVCSCAGCRCYVTKSVNMLVFLLFLVVVAIFIVNLALFTVCMTRKLQNPVVYVADAMLVRNRALLGYYADREQYEPLLSSLAEQYGEHDLYAYNVELGLLKTEYLSSQQPVAPAGVAAEELVLNELIAYNVTVFEDAQLYGQYFRVQGDVAEFSAQTDVLFGADATFSSDITFGTAEIDDLSVNRLNLTGFFIYQGEVEDLSVSTLNLVSATVNDLTSSEMNSTTAKTQTLLVGGEASISYLSTTNLSVQGGLTIRNSQIRLPDQLEFTSALSVNGDLKFNNKTRLVLQNESTITTISSIYASLKNGSVSSVIVDKLNLTSSKLASLTATTLDFGGQIKCAGQRILWSTNGKAQANFSSITCNDTFRVQKNLTAAQLQTKSVNITGETSALGSQTDPV